MDPKNEPQQALISFENASGGLSRELALSVQKRPGKAPAPTTPEGLNAGQILGQWIAWYKEGTGLPVPSSVSARMGRHVKGLILDGYTANEIKFGLAFWSVRETEDPRISPAELERFVWRYARETRADAQQWRNEMKQRVQQFGQAGYEARKTTTNKDRRNDANTAAAQEYLRRKNTTKEQAS